MFDFKCERCGADLEPGWDIDFVTGERVVTHLACPECDSTYSLPSNSEDCLKVKS